MATKPVSLLLYCCYLLLTSGVSAVSGIIPVIYPGKISSECSQTDPLEDEQFMEALRQNQQQLGPPGCNPPKNRSCQEINHCFPSAPSGYYQIHAANGSKMQVYCDMEGTNCGGEGGWTRVAYVNMSQPGATCPQGLDERNFTEATLCGRIRNEFVCNSTVFPISVEYSQVCGQVLGYQFGVTIAFDAYNSNNNLTIDDAYVCGVAITYGSTPCTQTCLDVCCWNY